MIEVYEVFNESSVRRQSYPIHDIVNLKSTSCPSQCTSTSYNMTVTRFLAAKFKEEYAGDDERPKQIREQIFQKTFSLYKSLPYISNIQGMHGQQIPPLNHGYHYAFVVEFESEEKVAHYNNVEPAHLEHKAYCIPYFETVFMWAFPPQN
ncbi:hypothetical protein K439DRAFT_879487 [Ramaria rubella]|nr:hypothetical protein K439DRAFT_879487 [Ramaria rubella]